MLGELSDLGSTGLLFNMHVWTAGWQGRLLVEHHWSMKLDASGYLLLSGMHVVIHGGVRWQANWRKCTTSGTAEAMPLSKGFGVWECL